MTYIINIFFSFLKAKQRIITRKIAGMSKEEVGNRTL